VRGLPPAPLHDGAARDVQVQLFLEGSPDLPKRNEPPLKLNPGGERGSLQDFTMNTADP